MTRLKTTAKLMAVLAMSFCLVPILWAQNAPPKKKTGHKPKAAAAASANAEASAPADAAKPKPDAEAGKRDRIPSISE